MFTARALFDNTSECDEELSFRQGDFLTVLHKDFNGLTGWWLCFLDGRVGLAPGNRLRIVSYTGSDKESMDPEQKKIQQQHHEVNQYDARQPIYDVPPSSSSSSSLLARNSSPMGKEATSGWRTDVIYDVPSSSVSRTHSPQTDLRSVASKSDQTVDYELPTPTRNNLNDTTGKVKPMNVTTDENIATPVRDCALGNMKENVPLGRQENVLPDNLMGNVRVCVEDEDETSSTGSGSTLAVNGNDIVHITVTPDPDDLGPFPNKSISKQSQTTDGFLRHQRSDVVNDDVKETNARQPWNNRYTQSSATLPRRSCQKEISKLERIREQRSPDDLGDRQNEMQKPSVTFAFPRPALDNKKTAERDSVLDDYSVPRNWKTFSPNSTRPSWNLYDYHDHHTGFSYEEHKPSKDVGKYRSLPNSKQTTPDAVPYRSKNENRNGNENTEFQLSFIDTGIYVDCPQDPDSVSESMKGLDQVIRSQVANVHQLCSGFDLTSYNRREDGEDKEEAVKQMRLCYLSLKTSLKEFEDFGTSALANAMQSTNRDFSENILQQLEMLRVLSQNLGPAVDQVVCTLKSGRDVDSNSSSSSSSRNRALRDALNSLMTLTHDVILPLSKMTDIVTRNSALIFTTSASVSPVQFHVDGPVIKEVRSPSPNMPPLTQFPCCGSTFSPSYRVQDLKTEPSSVGSSTHSSLNALRSSSPHSVQNFRSASPVQVLREFRPLSPNQKSSSPVSQSSTVHRVPSEQVPIKPEANDFIWKRPLPPLPSEERLNLSGKLYFDPYDVNRLSLEKTPVTVYDTAEANSEDNDYVSIANEAEQDMKRNVSVLVDRLADRSRNGEWRNAEMLNRTNDDTNDDQYLRPEEDRKREERNLGGLSPQFKERLDALKSSTEQTMRIACVRSRDNDYGYSSNPNEIQGYLSQFLVGIDREILVFYADQVSGHFAAVDSATTEFLSIATDESVTGNDLISLSRKVVLAAHKLVYASDAITKKLTDDEDLRRQVGSIASQLCLMLKETVTASKAAADSAAAAADRRCIGLEQIIDCMRKVKYLSLKLKDVIFVRLMNRIF